MLPVKAPPHPPTLLPCPSLCSPGIIVPRRSGGFTAPRIDYLHPSSPHRPMWLRRAERSLSHHYHHDTAGYHLTTPPAHCHRLDICEEELRGDQLALVLSQDLELHSSSDLCRINKDFDFSSPTPTHLSISPPINSPVSPCTTPAARHITPILALPTHHTASHHHPTTATLPSTTSQDPPPPHPPLTTSPPHTPPHTATYNPSIYHLLPTKSPAPPHPPCSTLHPPRRHTHQRHPFNLIISPPRAPLIAILVEGGEGGVMEVIGCCTEL